jgi:hypothetical protein
MEVVSGVRRQPSLVPPPKAPAGDTRRASSCGFEETRRVDAKTCKVCHARSVWARRGTSVRLGPRSGVAVGKVVTRRGGRTGSSTQAAAGVRGTAPAVLASGAGESGCHRRRHHGRLLDQQRGPDRDEGAADSPGIASSTPSPRATVASAVHQRGRPSVVVHA